MEVKSKSQGAFSPLRLKTIAILLAIVVCSITLLGVPVSEQQRKSNQWSSLEGTSRHLTSLTFPKYGDSSDNEEILQNYPAYLHFVLEVGKEVDHGSAQRLDHIYQKLQKSYPDGAARFLRGLRFEMVEKLQLAGYPPDAINTHNPMIRRWIAKYLPLWVREADENLFRAYANRLAKKD